MSVHQLADGRWICHYVEAGRQRREYFGRGPGAEARARARQQTVGVRARRPAADGISFGRLAQLYLDGLEARAEESTIDRHQKRLNQTLLPAFAPIAAAAITPDVCDDYVRLRSRSVKRITVHLELALVRTILRWGVKRGHLHHNPMEHAELPPADGAVIDPPTADEVTRIWRQAAPHLRRYIAIMWFCGCRAGREVTDLTWEAVDLEGGTITITSAKKGGLRSRRLRLHPILHEWLAEWKEDGHPYIVHFRGKRIYNSSWAWQDAKRRAGITRRLRLYDLRHAFATAIITGGGDYKTASVMIGHRQASTTLRIYTHATQAAQDAAIDLIRPIGK